MSDMCECFAEVHCASLKMNKFKKPLLMLLLYEEIVLTSEQSMP